MLAKPGFGKNMMSIVSQTQQARTSALVADHQSQTSAATPTSGHYQKSTAASRSKTLFSKSTSGVEFQQNGSFHHSHQVEQQQHTSLSPVLHHNHHLVGNRVLQSQQAQQQAGEQVDPSLSSKLIQQPKGLASFSPKSTHTDPLIRSRNTSAGHQIG